MTEEEAKTKWCHQTKRDVETSAELGTIRCIASGCMAWRWVVKDDITDEPPGFCGLAGKP